MKKFLTALFVFFTGCSVMSPVGAATPQAIYAARLQATDSEGTSITLNDSPCVSEKAASLLSKLNGMLQGAGMPLIAKKQLAAATVQYQGKIYAACWVRMQNVVAVMDETDEGNNLFPVPAAAFLALDPI